MLDYQSLLISIFHQTFWGASSLALAGATTEARRHVVKEYLFKHADEEKTHWTWALNDLLANEYAGPDITSCFPRPHCQAYISFNLQIAQAKPLARLGIATMLETLGATYGKKYANQLCQQLNLRPAQASFFYGHGDTDVGHTEELWGMLRSAALSPIEWGMLCFASETAFKLYNSMYDEAAELAKQSDFGLKV